MDTSKKIEWLGPEYEAKEQSSDWYWALGVIVVTIAVSSVLLKNYFFAILILLGGALLAYFSKQEPKLVHHELNNDGFKMKKRLFPYEGIKSFYVEKKEPATLFIRSDRVFMPVITVPIEATMANQIRDYLLAKKVTEEKMKIPEHEKILESFGL